MVIVFSGLPGTGKTAIARELARKVGAVHVRIDSIEQAIRDSGVARASIDDAGYRAAYAVAEDNLRLGRVVVADAVNPWPITRDAWLNVAKRAGAEALEVEVICSDVQAHRRRVETRTPDIAGLKPPTWDEILGRDYRPWDRDRLIVDTARRSVEENVAIICGAARLTPRAPSG